MQFNIEIGRKQASSITVDHKGQVETIDLTENDLLFITNGGCVESCTVGAQDKAAGFDPTIKPGNGWDLWRRVAAQDPSFGNPDKFCSKPEESNWESATITTLDDTIPQYIEKNLQAGSVQRPYRHGRHRHGQGFQLAPQLDSQSPTAVPGSAQKPALRLGLRPVQR